MGEPCGDSATDPDFDADRGDDAVGGVDGGVNPDFRRKRRARASATLGLIPSGGGFFACSDGAASPGGGGAPASVPASGLAVDGSLRGSFFGLDVASSESASSGFLTLVAGDLLAGSCFPFAGLESLWLLSAVSSTGSGKQSGLTCDESSPGEWADEPTWESGRLVGLVVMEETLEVDLLCDADETEEPLDFFLSTP